MSRRTIRLAVCCLSVALASCASRSVDVKPTPADPAEFLAWDCGHIADELDSVQQRAAEQAYTVDERAGDNILALGIGATIFWPAILAMRPDGVEARDLAALKGRYEALRVAAQRKSCPPPGIDLPPELAAEMPIAPGEHLVYDQRGGNGGGANGSWTLVVTALRRDEIDFSTGAHSRPWRQDRAGNVLAAPPGSLIWEHLLRHDLELGQVIAGNLSIVGDGFPRARVRGQVVAIGPQDLAGRHFDAAVIELFGDVQLPERSTRLDGALVVDRKSGVLLRLDLRSAVPRFNFQRRLIRIDGGH